MRKRPWQSTKNKKNKTCGKKTKLFSKLDAESKNIDYSIKNIYSKGNKTNQVVAANDGVIPRHPFRMYIVGSSGSGKSNLVLNLLTRPTFYKDYFENIVVISPTALNIDTSYEVMQLPEENFFQPEEEVLERIKVLQEERIDKAGGDKRKVPKMLIIFDDIVSHKSFCNSPIFLQFAVMSRHWNISLMILSQAYHRIPKSVRLQMSSVVYFKGSNKELDVLADDFSAPGISMKKFKTIISKSTNKRFDFFFVDIHRPFNRGRYKQNFTNEILI